MTDFLKGRRSYRRMKRAGLNAWEASQVEMYIEQGFGWEDIIVNLRPYPIDARSVYHYYWDLARRNPQYTTNEHPRPLTYRMVYGDVVQAQKKG